MKKLMKKKVNMFGKEISVFMITLVAIGLVSAALLPYFGIITGNAVVSQGLLVDGKSMPASGLITETLSDFTSLEQMSFVSAHYLDNGASVQADVKLTTTCDSNETTDSCTEITTATQLQLTTGLPYVRNPSIVKRGTEWYLFYANDTVSAQDGYGCTENNLNCDTHEYAIYVIKSTDDGKTWGTPVKVSTAITNFNQRDVSAVSDGTNLYAFVSNGASSSDYSIYYYSSSDNGITWTGPTDTTLDIGHFDATHDGTNFYITYLTGTTLEVRYSSNLSSWTTVTNSLANTHNSAVTKVMVDGSNLTVVWEKSGDGVYYSTSSTPKTQSWSVPVEIANSDVTGYGDYDPVLYKLGTGEYYLFWAPDGDNHQRIDYKVATSLNELANVESFTFSGSTSATTAWDYWPEVTQDSSGNLIVFYTSESSANTNPTTRVNGNIWMASFGDKERVIPANTELGLYTFKGFPKMTYPNTYTITTTVNAV